MPVVPEPIPSRIIEFEGVDDDFAIEFRVADLELNPIYRACAIAYLQPLQLALHLEEGHPRRISDEEVEKLLAKCYAASITVGSPSHPDRNEWKPAQWEAWLIGHSYQFAKLREYAEVRTNFVEASEIEEKLAEWTGQATAAAAVVS